MHKIHDQHLGGHHIHDKEAELALFKFTTEIFGKDGKLTKEQWAAQIDPFYDIIRPKTEWPYNGAQFSEEQIQEWVKLKNNNNAKKTWSNKDMTTEEIHEANIKYEMMRT